MRIILVWVVGIFLITVIGFTWYVTQPFIVKTTAVCDDIMEDMSQNRTEWENTVTIIDYVANLWPVPIVIAILIWMYISSQREDPESVLYS